MNDNSNESDSIQPSDYVNKTLEDLKAAKETQVISVDKLDHTINIIETGKDYWNQVDPESFKITPSGMAAVAFLAALSKEASIIRHAAVNAYDQISQFSGSSDAFVAVTNTAFSFVYKVNTFDPRKINEAIQKPEKDEIYARKFDAFDPELGKLYRQILQIRTRTSSHPAKSILSDIRQAYDHLMRVLAPDDEIRAQPGWKSVDPQKPSMVSRQQRLEYAANKHIVDLAHRSTVLASTKHILAVHDELNALYHTEEPLDKEKADAVTEAMTEVLNHWADALGL